jgi:hypothetical protein
MRLRAMGMRGCTGLAERLINGSGGPLVLLAFSFDFSC